MTDLGFAEKYLGRSLRPWWGASPIRMILVGLVQGAAFGVAAYVGWAISSGDLEGLEPDPSGTATLERVGLAVALLAVVGILYNLIRIAVAVVDLSTVHTVEGTLISCTARRMGDFLPGLIQDQIWSRGTDSSGYDRQDRRRVRTILVLATEDGPRSYTVGRALTLADGTDRPVRVRVSRLLRHVSRVE